MIRIVGASESESVCLSLEDTPIILAEVRKALPDLQRELSRKWPVAYVDIENNLPRRKNPFDPSQIIEAACIALVVGIAHQVGKELGTGEGLAIKKHLRRWLRNFDVVKQNRQLLNRKSRGAKNKKPRQTPRRPR